MGKDFSWRKMSNQGIVRPNYSPSRRGNKRKSQI